MELKHVIFILTNKIVKKEKKIKQLDTQNWEE